MERERAECYSIYIIVLDINTIYFLHVQKIILQECFNAYRTIIVIDSALFLFY